MMLRSTPVLGRLWEFHGVPIGWANLASLADGVTADNSVSLRFRQQATSGSTMTLAEIEKPSAVNEEGRLSN